jgi:ArsR family transcriptional regulator, cadmium/lead-responsive transcriptional repressor
MTEADDDRLWAALGDPMRLRVLDLLLERGEATASTLAGALPITRQGVAKHLGVLERAGLVAPRRAGREVRFAVREERLGQARRQMARVAARWDDRLAAIKRIAEGA